MYSKYDFNETDHAKIYLMRGELNNWIRFEPEKAKSFFEDRMEYVKSGLKTMHQCPFIGNTDDADLLLMEQALFCHEADSKEEFLEHVMTPELSRHVERRSKNLMQADIDTRMMIHSAPETASTNDAMEFIEEEMRNFYQMTTAQLEQFEARIRSFLLKKIKEDICKIFKREEGHLPNITAEDNDKNNISMIVALCLSEIDLITLNRNECGDARKEKGVTYYFDARTGYNENLTIARIYPELCCLMADCGYYLREEGREISDETLCKAIRAVDRFIHDETLISLDRLQLQYRKEEEEPGPVPAFAQKALSGSQPWQDCPEEKPKRNPHQIKRHLNSMPEGYFAKTVFLYICTYLLKDEIASDRIFTFSEKLERKRKGKSVDYDTYLLLRDELEKCRKDKEAADSKAVHLRKDLAKKEAVRKKQEEQIHALKAENRKLKTGTPSKEEAAEEENALLHRLRELEKENKELKRKDAERTARMQSLETSLSELKRKDAESGILKASEEPELYEGELYDFLTDVLESAFAASKEDTRRYDVLKGILSANPPTHNLKQKQERLKTIFKGTTDVSDRLKGQLKEIGVELTSETGKHAKFTLCGNGQYTFTLAKTPSDRRAGMNNAATVSDLMF